jgi:hypothetical protein
MAGLVRYDSWMTSGSISAIEASNFGGHIIGSELAGRLSDQGKVYDDGGFGFIGEQIAKAAEWFGSDVGVTQRERKGLAIAGRESEYLSGRNRMGYNSSLIRARGKALGQNDILSKGDIAAAIQEDPLSAIAFLETVNEGDPLFGSKKSLISRAEERVTELALSEGAAMLSADRRATATQGLALAGRYGNPRDVSLAAAVYGDASRSEIARLRQEATETADPAKKQTLIGQASRMETGLYYEEREAVLGSVFGLRRSEDTLFGARADSAFGRALFGGASSDALPWGARSEALRREESTLQAERDERRRMGMLSQAEDNDFQRKIEQARYSREVTLPREREQSHNRENVLGADLALATREAASAGDIMRMGAAGQTGAQYDLQIGGLSEKLRVYKEILETSKMLTNEERMQLETSIKQTEAQKTRLEVAKGIDVANATYGAAAAESFIASGPVQRSLGSGALSASQVGGANSQLLTLQDQTVRAAERRLQDLRSQGLAEDHSAVLAARSEVEVQKGRRQDLMHSMAVPGLTSSERIDRSNLSTALDLMQQGYGSFGDTRSVLRGLIGQEEVRVRNLQDNRSKMKANGQWDPEMEARFVEARNESVGRAARLAEEFNSGWDQRLISEAFNAPGQGRLGMSRYTRREAVLSGIVHRAFGGSEESTREMRMSAMAIARNLGSGKPANFADSALGGRDAQSQNVRVEISFVGEANRVLRATVAPQVSNQKTVQDFGGNVGEAKTKGG